MWFQVCPSKWNVDYPTEVSDLTFGFTSQTQCPTNFWIKCKLRFPENECGEISLSVGCIGIKLPEEGAIVFPFRVLIQMDVPRKAWRKQLCVSVFLFLCHPVNFEALIITIGVLLGLIIISIFACCCCCCRRCCRCRKNQSRWDGREMFRWFWKNWKIKSSNCTIY